jgi:hypothetical protein
MRALKKLGWGISMSFTSKALAAVTAGALTLAVSGAASPALAGKGGSGSNGASNSNGNAGSSGNASSSGVSGSNAGGDGGQGAFDISSTPTLCSLSDISPAASACTGWFAGNLNNGSDAVIAAQILNALLGTASFNAQNSGGVDDFIGSGSVIDFATPLFGDTVVAIHAGAAKGTPTGVGYQSTAFFRFDAGQVAGGLDTFAFNRAGLSNARLIYTSAYAPPCANGTCDDTPSFGNAVPEPAAWALMILGFGAAGAVLRHRRAVVA